MLLDLLFFTSPVIKLVSEYTTSILGGSASGIGASASGSSLHVPQVPYGLNIFGGIFFSLLTSAPSTGSIKLVYSLYSVPFTAVVDSILCSDHQDVFLG